MRETALKLIFFALTFSALSFAPLFSTSYPTARHYIDHILVGNGYDRFIRKPMAQEFIKLLNLKKEQSIADIGCATADFCWYFREKVGEKGRVYALDINPYLIDYARQRVEKKGVKNLIPLVNQETVFALPDSSVDAVLVSQIHKLGQLDQLHQEVFERPFLKEIARILKPGGRFLLVEVALSNPKVEHPLSQLYPEIVIKNAKINGLKAVYPKIKRSKIIGAPYLLFLRSE